MFLKGELVYLRKMEPEDLSFLYDVENNMTFWHVSETKAPYSRWELKQYIENYCYDIFTTKELRLIICNCKTGKPIGIIDLFEYHPLHNRCGVGLLVVPECARQGFASEALGLVMSYAFGTLLVKQIWCTIDVKNTASIALFEKAGFKQCGTLKEWKHSADGYSDVFVYQCIR